MGMGLRIEQGRHCDNRICGMGRWDLVKFGLGNGIGSPLRTLFTKPENRQSRHASFMSNQNSMYLHLDFNIVASLCISYFVALK